MSPRYLAWQRGTRSPRDRMPAGACDTAVHLFDPAFSAGLLPGRRYDPPDATLSDLCALQGRLGLSRAVLVQPSAYGSDHALLLASLRAQPERLRGIVLPDDDWRDETWQDLHDAGVRGLRLNLLTRWGEAMDLAVIERHVHRAEALGWSVSLHAPAIELVELASWLLRLRVPVVIDHLAYLTQAELAGPGGVFVRHALSLGNWWLKLSRVDHRFLPPHTEAVALMRQVVEWAPSRMLWASDWPHVLYDADACTLVDDADLVDLFARVVPDADVRERILVHHPAAVFGFAPVPSDPS